MKNKGVVLSVTSNVTVKIELF